MAALNHYDNNEFDEALKQFDGIRTLPKSFSTAESFMPPLENMRRPYVPLRFRLIDEG